MTGPESQAYLEVRGPSSLSPSLSGRGRYDDDGDVMMLMMMVMGMVMVLVDVGMDGDVDGGGDDDGDGDGDGDWSRLGAVSHPAILRAARGVCGASGVGMEHLEPSWSRMGGPSWKPLGAM